MPIVLIVDDSKTDQQLIRQFIQKQETDWIVDFSNSAEEAIVHLDQLAVDVVVTDMQMPGMSGLELLDHVRQAHPKIPVVLITEHDNDEIALDALRRGAASYVPKRELTSRLPEVIKQIVQVTGGTTQFEQIIRALDDVQFRMTLDNDPQLIPPLVAALDQIAHRMKLCSERGRQRIGVAVDEALLNAIYHGNLELSVDDLPEARAQLRNGNIVQAIEDRRAEAPYADRRVHVHASIDRQKIEISVRDDGSGFDVEAHPKSEAPTSVQHGLVVIRSLMDEVEFDNGGATILMKKYKEPEIESIATVPID